MKNFYMIVLQRKSNIYIGRSKSSGLSPKNQSLTTPCIPRNEGILTKVRKTEKKSV